MQEPTQRLPPAAKTYWHVTGLLQGLGVVIVALGFGGGLGAPAWVLLLVAVVVAVALAALVPSLRWRRWRYEIREEEIDLVRGAFVVRRTLIPIRRVQHVDTESGPLQESFGLATVTFHTAAGGVEIPALLKRDAESVRARVAELARTRDDT